MVRSESFKAWVPTRTTRPLPSARPRRLRRRSASRTQASARSRCNPAAGAVRRSAQPARPAGSRTPQYDAAGLQAQQLPPRILPASAAIEHDVHRPGTLGSLYVDGHAHVYYGTRTVQKTHAARLKSTAPATMETWVTGQDGDPVFMVIAEPSDSLAGEVRRLLRELRGIVGPARRSRPPAWSATAQSANGEPPSTRPSRASSPACEELIIRSAGWHARPNLQTGRGKPGYIE